MVVSSVWAAVWLLGLHLVARPSGYDIYFKGSVAGLKTGAGVYLAGVAVGSVGEIEIDPNDFTQVRVHIEVPTEIVVKTDSVATLGADMLMGYRWINITGGSRSAPRLSASPGHPYPVIPSQPSELQGYAEWAPQAVARVIEVEDWLIETLSDSNLRKGSNVLETLEGVTAPGARGLDATIDRVNSALDGARTNASELQGWLGESKETLSVAEAKLESASAVIREAGKTAQSADTVVQQKRPEIRDLAQTQLTALEVIIGDIRVLIAQLTRRIDDIERNPGGILFGRQREGYEPRPR